MISIVVGTNRPHSNSRIIADIYQQILKNNLVNSEIIDLATLPPDFTVSALYDNAQKNPDFNAIANKMVAATKIVFIIPEYNGSFPGVLKAFIDGLPHPGSLKNKKGAMIGISSGALGSTVSMSNFSDILCYLGMNVLANRPKLSNIENYLKNGEIINPKYLEQLGNQAKLLIEF
jgi:chromate reductase, NAD(P)H dehydrogenase (quinone)